MPICLLPHHSPKRRRRRSASNASTSTDTTDATEDSADVTMTQQSADSQSTETSRSVLEAVRLHSIPSLTCLDIPKRLNQALVNAEVSEASNKALLEEVDDARATISRLTGYQARSLGWETKVAAAQRERDDMQQERDGESQRARLAESRFNALKEKTSVSSTFLGHDPYLILFVEKLQAELRRLQEELEEKRMHRLETSESLIQDARSRIHSFQQSSQTVRLMPLPQRSCSFRVRELPNPTKLSTRR